MLTMVAAGPQSLSCYNAAVVRYRASIVAAGPQSLSCYNLPRAEDDDGGVAAGPQSLSCYNPEGLLYALAVLRLALNL